ncbi:MAG: response regulator transcription factor [Rhodospirillaceae bacterium]|nr:response regulator transcription factor [Rhodospirillaceae bacterium]MBT7285833.1 response regulator transcription factor [Rhodospirillaceae bacterium]
MTPQTTPSPDAPDAPRRILIIEDDADIASLIAMHLGDNGFGVQVESQGNAGLAAFKGSAFDLVVLDLMLPGVDGLTLCREMRAGNSYIPILMLTAKATELDRVLGLEMGADDYLTKPFSLPELIARVKALLRRVDALSTRQESPTPAPVIEKNGMTINVDKRLVSIEGKEISLTAREFDLLHHLASHPGHVYSRIQLLDQVWGYSYEGYEHTVNTHINRLRAKIEEDPANPAYVQTVWGVGYKFVS